MITVVNKHTHTKTDHDIYIGRGSVLGNPFTHRPFDTTMAKFQCSSRDEAIQRYEKHFGQQLHKPDFKAEVARIYRMAKQGDVNLVCFCKPKSCHGDIIKQFIEQYL